MADFEKVTIKELKENNFSINKKFLLINHSLYTDEAYEYILGLINETDSVAFISDTRQIYTHGQYFGGDLWEDKLFYFGNFQILTDNDELKVSLDAEEQKESLRLKGINNINISAEEKFINGEKLKTIIFDYDIANTIDTGIITIDDPTAQYNLEIEDGKIHVNKYIPIRVELSPSYEPRLIEYDAPISGITFPVNVYGTDTEKHIFVSASNDDSVAFDESDGTINATFQNTTEDINYLVVYGDSTTQNSLTITQEFGFANVYGDEEVSLTNFFKLDRYISKTDCEGEISISIDEDKYGWFACPSQFNPVFIDKESNIGGGWQYAGSKVFYTLGISYNIYRTEHSGLGNTKWIIKNF